MSHDGEDYMQQMLRHQREQDEAVERARRWRAAGNPAHELGNNDSSDEDGAGNE